MKMLPSKMAVRYFPAGGKSIQCTSDVRCAMRSDCVLCRGIAREGYSDRPTTRDVFEKLLWRRTCFGNYLTLSRWLAILICVMFGIGSVVACLSLVYMYTGLASTPGNWMRLQYVQQI